jgi:hypothetical protein
MGGNMDDTAVQVAAAALAVGIVAIPWLFIRARSRRRDSREISHPENLEPPPGAVCPYCGGSLVATRMAEDEFQCQSCGAWWIVK